MKVYFASLTDLTLTVDAWVPSVEQGYTVLTALADKHHQHSVVMRARLRRFYDHEERYVGIAAGSDADDFLNRVALMGGREPNGERV